MPDQYERTRRLLGDAALDRLRASRVAVFGLGGVGGYVVEALARSGVGTLDLVDDDRLSLSNLNRQLLATHAALGVCKTDAAAARVRDIDPDITVHTHKIFYGPATRDQLEFAGFDYVVDAIDTVTGKLALIQQARAAGVPIISCMGTGNRLDPTALTVGDIYATSGCPLARVMRRELKKRGVTSLKVVWSREPPLTPAPPAPEPAGEGDAPGAARGPAGRRDVPGSAPFVPAAAGLILAAEVVRDLIGGRPADHTNG